MIRHHMLCLAVGMLLAPEAASAQGVGDAEKGLAFARQNCSECHAVEAGTLESPDPEAPSFASVAETRGMSWIALSAFLQTPHKTMPNIVLPQDDREDVIAYILSLKR